MKNNAGALWLQTSKQGKKFMSGVVEIEGVKTKIVVFKNDHKADDKHPDYKIYLSEERKEQVDDDGTSPF